jgi:hypothetical protein
MYDPPKVVSREEFGGHFFAEMWNVNDIIIVTTILEDNFLLSSSFTSS